MEKISSILPASRRVKEVDLDEAHPVRPGTPSLGRPVGMTSSMRDKIALSAKAREENKKIADTVNNGFANTPVNQIKHSEPASSDNIQNVLYSLPTPEADGVITITVAPAEEGSTQSLDKYA